jgi:hypothetical protein
VYVNRYNPRMGDDLTTTITDVLPDAYSDTSTITGLPLVWELGLGLLGAAFLLTWGRKKVRVVRRRLRRRFSS